MAPNVSPRGEHRILYVSDPSTVAKTHLPDPATEADIRRWVDSVADSGVDMFDQEIWSQGWTAWWRSEQYQYDQRHQHRRFHDLLDSGTQPLDIIIDQCHRRGMKFIGGFRMNDGHAYQAREQGLDIAEFIASHPEFQLTDLPEGEHYTQTEPLDFTHQEVRDFTLGVIEEVADRFEIDGVELCFRDCSYFPHGTAPDRAPLMTDLIRQIRDNLDSRSEVIGRKLILGARHYATIAECASLGLDAPTWIEEDLLGYIAPQDAMYADFNLPYEEWSALTRKSDCLLYPGINPWTSIRRRYRLKRIPLSHANFRALAKTMYSCGADGVSVFNHFVPAMWTAPFYPQGMQPLWQLRDPGRVGRGERHYIFDPTYEGQTGFGVEGMCSSRVVKMQQLVLDRTSEGDSGSFAFQLFEDLETAHVATLLFRGTGLTENDILEVRLNGHLIADDQIGRTAVSDTPAKPDGTYFRTEGDREIPCIPEMGWFDGRSDPTPVFSTRWFTLSKNIVAWGSNSLEVTLFEGDPDARGDRIIIDEVEVFVEPK